MNMKMKAVAVAVAMAAAGSANAAIDIYNTQNGELFFSLYDPVAQKSFSMDLAPVASDPTMGTFNLNNFLPIGVPPGTAGSNTGGTKSSIPGYVLTPGKSYTWHLDNTNSAFGQYLASGANLAASRWSVVAGDAVGSGTVKDALRYISTSKDNIDLVDNTPAGTNLTGFNLTAVYVTALNATNVGEDFTAFHTSADGDAYVGQGLTETFKGKAAFNSMALVGESQDFFYITGQPGAGATVSVTQFSNPVGNAKWTFAANTTLGGYDLTYQAPVPVPAAVWLLGSALVGLVGVARRQQKAA